MSTKSKSKRNDRSKKGAVSRRMASVSHAGAAASIMSMLGHHAVIEAGFAEPISELLRIERGIKNWMALHLIKTSSAVTEYTWMPLCEAVNIGMILSERGIGAEYEASFLAAQEAITRAWTRSGQHGIARLDGAGMSEIALALEVHDGQLELAMRGQLAAADSEMRRRSAKGNVVRVEEQRKAA